MADDQAIPQAPLPADSWQQGQLRRQSSSTEYSKGDRVALRMSSRGLDCFVGVCQVMETTPGMTRRHWGMLIDGHTENMQKERTEERGSGETSDDKLTTKDTMRRSADVSADDSWVYMNHPDEPGSSLGEEADISWVKL